jgi:hypothetical protein
MTRRKRSSLLLEKAQRRAAGLRSIDAGLDLGNGMTLQVYQTAVDGLRERQDRYNTLLSSIDQAYNELLEEERSLGELSERMLSAVKVKYGRDSNEYEMAGGVRRSERRRPKQSGVAVKSVG